MIPDLVQEKTPQQGPPPADRLHPDTLSGAGVDFIARWEGFRAYPYNDATGNATIGFGHLLHRGPVDQHDNAIYARGLSRSDALGLLRGDCGIAIRAVRSSVHVHLTQPQFDALVSFTFNCGTGALQTSQLLRDINTGHYQLVPGDLLHWCHGNHGDVIPGLVRRRHAEGAMFAHAVYRPT